MEKVTENQKTPTFRVQDSNAIAEMAINHKIPIFPCNKNKHPVIDGGHNSASYDPKQINRWKMAPGFCYWGMPTDRFFAIDKDGENWGKLKTQWFENNPYTQITKSGGRHWLFKQPEKKSVRCKVRFTGDFDVRGDGGYIIIYSSALFSEFQLPENVPDAPSELIGALKSGKSKADFTEGNRNNSLNKKLFIDLVKNKGRNTHKILDQAEKSGLSQKEIEATGQSAIDAAIETGIEPDPIPPKTGSVKERSKAKKPFARKLTGKIYKTHYNDDNKMCLRGFLGCVTGEKLAMKSRGMVSYLLENGNKIGYFSGGENTEEQLTAIQKVFEKEDDIIWLDLAQKGWPKEIAGAVKEYSLKTIFEDPPSEEWESQGIAREALSLRAQLAKELNVCWMFSRNFSKKKYDRLLSNVSGFGQITNIPRFVIGAFPIEIGHKLRPDESSPKVSLLQTIACNEGPTPSQSIIAKVNITSLEAENSERADIATCNIMKTPYIQDPQRYVLAPKSTAERDTTREFQVLMLLKDKEKGLNRADLVAEIVKMFEVSEPTADRLKTELREKNLISGGGKDKKAPFKITTQGLKRLEGPKQKKKGGKKG